MSDKKKYLILTYNFPPDASIGSRRWAKFTKYLVKSGVNVKVLTTQTDNQFSPWDQDVKNIHCTRLKNNYPQILDTTPISVFDRIRYRLALIRLTLIARGTIYDRGILLQKSILSELEKRYQLDRPQIIIANGPPHSFLYYLALFKKNHPEVSCWGDFRDPWTWWYNMGYAALKGRRKIHEEELEKKVVTTLDRIFVPDQDMMNYLGAKYPQQKNKIELLPHGFDPNDFENTSSKVNVNTGKVLKLVMAGTMYAGLDKEIKFFNDWILAADGKVSLSIYTSDLKYRDIFERNLFVEYHAPIKSNKFYEKLMMESDFFVLIYPETFKNYFATKFYEVCAAKVPFIYIGTEGNTASFIENKKLGLWLNSKIIEKEFEYFYETLNDYTFEPQLDFLSEFNFESITKKLE
jgi:hypothetical protein